MQQRKARIVAQKNRTKRSCNTSVLIKPVTFTQWTSTICDNTLATVHHMCTVNATYTITHSPKHLGREKKIVKIKPTLSTWTKYRNHKISISELSTTIISVRWPTRFLSKPNWIKQSGSQLNHSRKTNQKAQYDWIHLVNSHSATPNTKNNTWFIPINSWKKKYRKPTCSSEGRDRWCSINTGHIKR